MDMQSTDMVGTRTELAHALDSWAIRATAYLRADTKAPLLVYVEDGCQEGCHRCNGQPCDRIF